MSLTTDKNGAVTLSEDRHRVCMEAAWELEALAYVLPQVTSNSDIDSLNSGFVVRGIAARFVTLSNVLIAALYDSDEETEKLERKVLVAPFKGGA